MEVAELLSRALKIATDEGSVGWVTAWLDARDDLGDFGHTLALKEEVENLEAQVEGLEEEKSDLLAVYPKGFPLDLSLSEQLQVEEFFRHLRDPAHRPAAGERLEALLQRCRGFKVEQLEQVLLWMDGHAWGELPFGPTDRLKEKVADLLETEKELRQREEDLSSQVVGLRGQVADLMRGAKKWEERAALLERTCAAQDKEAADPRVRFVAQHEEIPLEALEWIVRVVKGEEPPFTDDHLETVRLLWESGEMLAAVLGASILRDGPHQVAILKRLDTLKGKTDTLFREAGLL